ncbi:hypothetical protein AB0I28_20145 [Phytomonospora sp. NPDC050363]|uniref:hypothetical protein n=1 Tax=Phytomonospora sp. NPDC050363 TaxID=3155642 RepID=UPI0033EE8109
MPQSRMPEPRPEPSPPSQRAWWILHAAVLATGVLITVAFSPPGFDFVLAALMIPAPFGIAIAWLAMFADGGHAGHRSWQLVIAPVVAAAVLVALIAQVPREARWALSRPAFDDLVATLPVPAPGTAPDWDGWSDEREIGTYTITAAFAVTGGYWFYEDNGAFFDDAGIAYLPSGPGPELADDGFDSARFHALGDHWYTWTHSW